jgi:hypothetical protein
MSGPPTRESRPEANRTADISTAIKNDVSVAPATDSAVLARRRWALAMIQRCQAPPPSYGSAAWLELAEGDVAKVAAVVIAAESWATDGDNLEENLRVEVAQLQASHKRLEDEEYVANRDAHRAYWSGKDWRPHPANRRAGVVCPFCDTPTSPWTCSCGQTRVGGAA